MNQQQQEEFKHSEITRKIIGWLACTLSQISYDWFLRNNDFTGGWNGSVSTALVELAE